LENHDLNHDLLLKQAADLFLSKENFNQNCDSVLMLFWSTLIVPMLQQRKELVEKLLKVGALPPNDGNSWNEDQETNLKAFLSQVQGINLGISWIEKKHSNAQERSVKMSCNLPMLICEKHRH
jgi:hypothetical protein